MISTYPLFITKYYKRKKRVFVLDFTLNRDLEIRDFCSNHRAEGEVILTKNCLYLKVDNL
jgi:hypothetical protein